MYEIVIGRSPSDREKFGLKGTIFLGRHYVKMGQTTSLSSDIRFDVNRTHVVFICGKRGSGKSYTMGSVAEGIATLPEETAKNICTIIFDTMGIYWTMKYPNHKDAALLEEWKIEAKSLDVQIYTPIGFYKDYKSKGIPVDYPFSLRPSELSAAEWNMTFGLEPNSEAGVLVERILHKLRREKKQDFSINDIIKTAKQDTSAEKVTKDIVENQFRKTKSWGLFSTKGTPISELSYGGKTIIMDISPASWDIRSLIIGIISKKLFNERMTARRTEEYEAVQKAEYFFSKEEKTRKRKSPLIWLMLDEAHEFLPREGTTAATDALITILREGRQPGISLVLASQQPGKIHTDVMTQADTVMSHRLTAKIDIEALGALMQSYMRQGLDVELDKLPRVKGAALIFDDMNEKLYPMQMRPRSTWHGGAAPSALSDLKKEIEL